MQLSHDDLRLPLADPFTIARETKTHADNLLVRIAHEQDGQRFQGLGEFAPHAFLGAPHEAGVAALERVAGDATLLGDDPFALDAIEARLLEAIGDCRPALAAVIGALLDLQGQILGQPLWRIWGLDWSRAPCTSYTIGIDSTDYMVEKARRAIGRGFHHLKIKLGTDRDLAMVEAIAGAGDCVLRGDANCAWGADECIEKGRALEKLGVELIEQPLPPEHDAELPRVCEALSVPVVADESVKDSRDVARLAGLVDGINIKLAKCGGPREALRMIHCARAHGMQVMLGCMIESAVGIAAAAQLAPLLDFADLDGHLLLAENPYWGVDNDGERLLAPDAPGLGLRPQE